jgi:O-acetyl-ADP-ribose deacetylase (regulator of RNase III)
MWFGGIDGVIMSHAGSFFHKQAAKKILRDGQVIVAYGAGLHRIRGFENVVFVVDDLQRPLREIIGAGLDAADREGFKTVTLPTIRMGVMLGVVEKTPNDALIEMVMAIKEFYESHPKSLNKITFVVYGDEAVADKLRIMLRALSCDWG